MNIQTLNFLLSFIITVVLGLIIIPRLKKLKIGQIVRTDGPKEHLKKSGTPTMGGIIMLIAIVLILGFNTFKYTILVLPIIAILGFGIVGFVDDYKKLILKSPEGLSPKKKILGLFIVISIFILAYINIFHLGLEVIIPVFNEPFMMPLALFVLFTSFVLLSTSNAINLTDGLDGLATGISAIIMSFFTIIAIKNQETSMIILGATTVGTCLGFLVFNANPAKVFMGDTGSLALGGAIASIAIITKTPLYILIVAIIPIIETISVILQVLYFKITKGKRLFKMAPYHHHLELKGIKEAVIVRVFYLVTALACVVAYFI